MSLLQLIRERGTRPSPPQSAPPAKARPAAKAEPAAVPAAPKPTATPPATRAPAAPAAKPRAAAPPAKPPTVESTAAELRAAGVRPWVATRAAELIVNDGKDREVALRAATLHEKGMSPGFALATAAAKVKSEKRQ